MTKSYTRRDPDGIPNAFGDPDDGDGRLPRALTCGFSGAEDGIRIRNPDLGNHGGRLMHLRRSHQCP